MLVKKAKVGEDVPDCSFREGNGQLSSVFLLVVILWLLTPVYDKHVDG